jgi:hypothetical protein
VLSASQLAFSVLFAEEGAELCEDTESVEKTEDDEEEAKEAIEEAYG